MAQVKLLKIGSTGIPYEFDSASDEITLASYTVQGGGPVLSSTGLDMNNQDVSDVNDLAFNDPTTGTINQTAGNLVIDNLMAKERSNTLTTAADILFPVITDVAGEVDMLRLPALAGSPSASPTASGEGFLVWDSTNDKMFAWNGSAWMDQSLAEEAKSIQNLYTADGAIAARDVLYISAADKAKKAACTSVGNESYAIGLAVAAAADTDPVESQSAGVMAGFSGLTAGSRYFLSATAGAITPTVPVASGNVVVQVGYAKSATELQIQILQLGRRA